jgi:isopentenyl-diphosphate delta-isomerase
LNDVRDNRDTVVSFDGEALILVDDNDAEIGYLSKAEAHRGIGRLHRAFSLFVFDEQGRLLIQQRAANKRLWPLYWSNTCCSHPRRGENMENAVQRRLGEELGLRCRLEFLFKFQYHAQFDAEGSENEVCWVYAGRTSQSPRINRLEVSDLRYVEPDVLDEEMRFSDRMFTPWFRLEWSRIRSERLDLGAPLKKVATQI